MHSSSNGRLACPRARRASSGSRLASRFGARRTPSCKGAPSAPGSESAGRLGCPGGFRPVETCSFQTWPDSVAHVSRSWPPGRERQRGRSPRSAV
jgi:hypothetical protein